MKKISGREESEKEGRKKKREKVHDCQMLEWETWERDSGWKGWKKQLNRIFFQMGDRDKEKCLIRSLNAENIESSAKVQIKK